MEPGAPRPRGRSKQSIEGNEWNEMEWSEMKFISIELWLRGYGPEAISSSISLH